MGKIHAIKGSPKQTPVFVWLDIVTAGKKNKVCHNNQRVRCTQEQLISPGPKPPPCYPPSTPGLPLWGEENNLDSAVTCKRQCQMKQPNRNRSYILCQWNSVIQYVFNCSFTRHKKNILSF